MHFKKGICGQSYLGENIVKFTKKYLVSLQNMILLLILNFI